MGIHFSEIRPVGGCNQAETQALAQKLWEAAGKHAGLPLGVINSILEECGKPEYPLSLYDLSEAGWIEEPAQSRRRGVPEGCFSLTQNVGDVAHAPREPRMSFAEACRQIETVRERLDAAPAEIEGIKINTLFLFGSTLRDNNSRETIGDLDIAAEFSFDARYEGMEAKEKTEIAKKRWNDIISHGDSRLQLGEASGLPQAPDMPERPFALLRIWENKTPGPSGFSQESREKIEEREARTCAGNARAQEVARLVGHGLAMQSRFLRAPGATPGAETHRPSTHGKNAL